jgi:signal transduction histidine kinase
MGLLGAIQLFLIFFALQPLLSYLRSLLASRLLPGQGDLEGLARALAEAESRSDQAERLAEIGRLSSAVAHELRNPLGVIQVATKTLARRATDPISAAAIAEIDTQIERARTFTEELLDYARPAPLRPRDFELPTAIELAWGESCRGLPLDPQPTFEITITAPPGETIVICADMGQTLRLFTILFENARLALYPNPGQVRVRILRHSTRVDLLVEDSGPGIDPEVRPRLFQPFVSGRPREGPKPGTGLGLAIARAIAERHGGRLELQLEPSPLGGATFRIELPLRPPLPLGTA